MITRRYKLYRSYGHSRWIAAANVVEIDKVLRLGAKVQVLGGWSGGGFERVIVRGLTRGPHVAEKYLPITRLDNFRAAWVLPHLRSTKYFLATKEEMTNRALTLSEIADRERAIHLNRAHP